MRDDDADRAKRPVTHLIGESLDILSVDEIEQRISVFEAEIRRLEAAVAATKSALDQAASIFRL